MHEGLSKLMWSSILLRLKDKSFGKNGEYGGQGIRKGFKVVVLNDKDDIAELFGAMLMAAAIGSRGRRR